MTITTPTFDADGIRGLTLAEIYENLETRIHQHTDLGPDVSTGEHSLVGILIEAVSPEIELLYRLADDIYASGDQSQAEGVAMDAIARIRGTTRNPARSSTATVTLGGTAATPVPAGSLVAIPNGGAQWATDIDCIIGGGGTVDVDVTAVLTGPTAAALGAISDVVTAIGGWNTVTNAAAAETGALVESDTDLRLRSAEISSGTTTEEAIWSRLADLDDVEAAVVTSNRSDTTDGNGTPPHSYWIIIHPNTVDPQTIVETIWGDAGAGAGIAFRGTQTGYVMADDGELKVIAWDWASAVDVWSRVAVLTDTDYPTDGDALIEAAVIAYGETTRVGQDVYPAQIAKQILNAVPGIKTISVALKAGSAPGAGDTSPLAIALNQYGAINAGEIEVIST